MGGANSSLTGSPEDPDAIQRPMSFASLSAVLEEGRWEHTEQDAEEQFDSPLPADDSIISTIAIAIPDICDRDTSRAAALGSALLDSFDVEMGLGCANVMPQEDQVEQVPELPIEASSFSNDVLRVPFECRDWQVPKRYELRKVLGRGTYGTVCSAQDTRENRIVAVKKVQNLFTNAEECKRILREVAILSHLKHGHVVRIFDLPRPESLTNFSDLYIVMECCDTDLKKVCSSWQGVSLAQARQLAYGLVVGCSYLHSAGVYHRDLKPANCLVNRDCTLKICDFNLARIVDRPAHNARPESDLGGPPVKSDTSDGSLPPPMPPLQRDLTTHVVSRWYRPPEVILAMGYTEAMDVWSAGCILAEIFCALSEGDNEPCIRVLFPGAECFPLELARSDPMPHDQLDVIFDVLGTPSEKELATLPDEGVVQHILQYNPRPGSGLRSHVPVGAASEDGVALLEQMVHFLPQQRISMATAVRHPFLARARKSPDDGRLERVPLDLGYDEDAVSGPSAIGSRREKMRKELQAVIATYHPPNSPSQQ